jgi:hypothetical protein
LRERERGGGGGGGGNKKDPAERIVTGPGGPTVERRSRQRERERERGPPGNLGVTSARGGWSRRLI